MNSTISPPKKTADDDIEKICNSNEGPQDPSEQILRRHQDEGIFDRVREILLKAGRLCDVHWKNYGAAHNSKGEEHVSAHAHESKEYGSVKSDLFDILVFIILENGIDPSEQPFAHWRWAMFFSRVNKFGCVHGGVERTNEEEDDEDGGSNGKSCGNGDYYRVLSYSASKRVAHQVEEFVSSCIAPQWRRGSIGRHPVDGVNCDGCNGITRRESG